MDDVAVLDAVVFNMAPPSGYSRSADDLIGRASIPSQLPDKVYGPSVSPNDLADDHDALSRELGNLTSNGEVIIATPPASAGYLGRPEVHGVPTPHLQRRLDGVKYSGKITEAITDQSKYPYTAIGRLTYSIDGRVRYCTAWVVSERVIVTAGHCVFSRSVSRRRETGISTENSVSLERNKKGFADWTIFEPAYRAGKVTEKWAGVRGYVLKDWVSPQEGAPTSPHDFAFVVLDKPILHKTGALGVRVANPDSPDATVSLGYPLNPTSQYAFDGKYLYASTGKTKSAALGVWETENQLSEGSSGGPWLSKTRDGVVVTGINSNKPLHDDDTTYSPIIGQSFIALLSRVLSDLTGV